MPFLQWTFWLFKCRINRPWSCVCVWNVTTAIKILFKASIFLFVRLNIRYSGYEILCGITSLAAAVQTLWEISFLFSLQVGLKRLFMWLYFAILREAHVSFHVVVLIIWASCMHHVDIFLYDTSFSSYLCVGMLTIFVKIIIIFLKTFLYGKFSLF